MWNSWSQILYWEVLLRYMMVSIWRKEKGSVKKILGFRFNWLNGWGYIPRGGNSGREHVLVGRSLCYHSCVPPVLRPFHPDLSPRRLTCMDRLNGLPCFPVSGWVLPMVRRSQGRRRVMSGYFFPQLTVSCLFPFAFYYFTPWRIVFLRFFFFFFWLLNSS